MGDVTQTGGDVSGDLQVGTGLSGQIASYTMNGGTLTGDFINIGQIQAFHPRSGEFVQHGGNVTSTNNIFISTTPDQTARWELNGGAINAENLTVGALKIDHAHSIISHGELVQNLGDVTARRLTVSAISTYTMNFGTLTIGRQMQMRGTFNFNGGSVHFEDSSSGNFSQGTITAAMETSMTAETNTLLQSPRRSIHTPISVISAARGSFTSPASRW
jgi:hypothetical protein